MLIKNLKHVPGLTITFEVENHSDTFEIVINRTDYGASMTCTDVLVDDFSDDDLDKLDDLMSSLSSLLM